MHNFTQYITIENFKSIQHIELEDCRRINLFIGKPNVGKSNLLEAISLFSLPYLRYTKKKTIRQFIRVENDAELFFDGDIENRISVQSSQGNVSLDETSNGLYAELSLMDAGLSPVGILFNELTTKRNIEEISFNPFKSYYFPNSFEKEKNPLTCLLPPYGSNLMSIVSQLPQLKEELNDIFNAYGLQYAFDTNSQEIKVIKQKKPGEIFLIPFHSVADTLQRMIFYKAAIESNHNSILTFEEPEAHSYPPYISRITQSVIASETNQFFITTHSPYVLNDFLEWNSNEVAINIVDLKEGKTVVKRLSDKELQDVYEYGADLFFNTETFLQE